MELKHQNFKLEKTALTEPKLPNKFKKRSLKFKNIKWFFNKKRWSNFNVWFLDHAYTLLAFVMGTGVFVLIILALLRYLFNFNVFF